MALVVLDLQHLGRGGRHEGDMGAAADLDGDGRTECHEREALLALGYLTAAGLELNRRGHQVIVLSQGEYPDRQALAVELALEASTLRRRAVYVACHINAGKGNYGLVLHDRRAAKGAAVAAAVAEQLAGLPEIPRALTKAAVGEWGRAAPCIEGAWTHGELLPAIVFEPCFIDQPAHAALLSPEGLQRIGRALAEGRHKAV
ncbi:MAG: N-acetylmuramoyl-L-alanine amidase, partial [Myxococcales bacterium]|nr:N-acetylmuramoyl-L-alanine amidase [Myxococcales bacterium]